MKRLLIRYRKNLHPMHNGSLTCQDGQWILACPYCRWTMHINEDHCIIQYPNMLFDIFPVITCKNVNCKRSYTIAMNEVKPEATPVGKLQSWWVQEGPTKL